MKNVRRNIVRDQDGAAAIEMAFALPVLIVMIWMIVQLAEVYRAVAGIQQALGEGARYATLVPHSEPDRLHALRRPPRSRRRSTPAFTASGLGTFTVPTPDKQTDGGIEQLLRHHGQLHPADEPAAAARSDDQRVASKRVWVAGA